jgi:hypothetical protein
VIRDEIEAFKGRIDFGGVIGCHWHHCCSGRDFVGSFWFYQNEDAGNSLF